MAPAITVIPVSSKVLVASFTLASAVSGRTIRRTRGEAFISATGPGAGLGAMGMIMVSLTALAAGAASIPGPVTDASHDGWFVWQSLIRDRPAATQQESDPFTFDSKAMRKMEEGYAAVMMVENASAALAFRFAFGVAVLSTIT